VLVPGLSRQIALPLLLALLAGVAATVAAPATATERAAPFEPKLQRALDAAVSAGPGTLALVRAPHRTISRARPYGDLTTRAPLRVSDRFRVGSSTKTFVAAVVLQLVGERTLALDDTVERWLPGLVPGVSSIPSTATVHAW